MLFNGINFKFGEIGIAITSVDTEKSTGYLEIKIPIGKCELEINLKRWIGWNQNTEISLQFDFRTPKIDEPEETDDEELEEDDDEEESAES